MCDLGQAVLPSMVSRPDNQYVADSVSYVWPGCSIVQSCNSTDVWFETAIVSRRAPKLAAAVHFDVEIYLWNCRMGRDCARKVFLQATGMLAVVVQAAKQTLAQHNHHPHLYWASVTANFGAHGVPSVCEPAMLQAHGLQIMWTLHSSS